MHHVMNGYVSAIIQGLRGDKGEPGSPGLPGFSGPKGPPVSFIDRKLIAAHVFDQLFIIFFFFHFRAHLVQLAQKENK